VRTELGRDPGLATQAGMRTGWVPLHAASASRWRRLDPARQAISSNPLTGSQYSGSLAFASHLDRGTPPCGDVMPSVHFVTMTLMSELPAGDTHGVIRHSGQVVAVVVPIEEYQQLRQAMQERQVNEEFDAARARYLARREAGAIRYVSHEEAGRRLGMPSR